MPANGPLTDAQRKAINQALAAINEAYALVEQAEQGLVDMVEPRARLDHVKSRLLAKKKAYFADKP